MINYQEILGNLREINVYFMGCLDKAGVGSSAERRFERYIATVAAAQAIVKDAKRQEDDGK